MRAAPLRKRTSTPISCAGSRKRRRSVASSSLYVDETVADTTPFGDVRQRAYTIMPRDRLQTTAQRMSGRPASKLARHWQAVDRVAERIRRQVRPLYGVLDFASVDPNNPWLAALAWAKSVFAKQQRLSQRPLAECPVTLPKQLQPYLLTSDADGKPTGLHADRFEFWLYRQIRKRLRSGELFLDDSLQHRHFADELVSTDEQADVLAQHGYPVPAPADRDPAHGADGRAARTVAGLQSRAEAGQADASGLRQGHADPDLAQTQGRQAAGTRSGVLRATAVVRCR